MAFSTDALRLSSSCNRAHIHVLEQCCTLFICQLRGFPRSSGVELGNSGQTRNAITLPHPCRPSIYYLSQGRKSGKMSRGFGDDRDKSRNGALSLMVNRLIAAGTDREEAKRISLNRPLFIQKLLGRSIEADEMAQFELRSRG